MIDRLRRCRSRAVPLVAVTTADEMGTTDTIASIAGNEIHDADAACAAWSLATGWTPRNDAATAALSRMTENPDPYDPPAVAALRAASKAPAGALLIFIGAHRFCGQPACEEWLKALRDPCKATGRTIALLGPSFAWGADLAPHVEQLSDDLPDDKDREHIIRQNIAETFPVSHFPHQFHR